MKLLNLVKTTYTLSGLVAWQENAEMKLLFCDLRLSAGFW